MDIEIAPVNNQIADLFIHEEEKVSESELKALVMEEITCDLASSSSSSSSSKAVLFENDGVCAICLDKISLLEIALIKGCEHAYCVTCILRWATYRENPSCPQCKHPFQSLNIHRSLDGRIHDYMFEESVCLLLRATWFVPLSIEPQEEPYDEFEDVYQYYEEDDNDDDLDEVYYNRGATSVRIGNRRWGDNGYVRAGRIEARPANREKQAQAQDGDDAGSSRTPMKKKEAKEATGRRAKRALKREAADKAAAAKHQSHLQRLGRT